MLSKLRNTIAFAKFLYVQRFKGFEVSDSPWVDDETRLWFERRLSRSQSYLEFGAGGSTRLSGRLGIPTVSVESDRFFARAVRNGLAPQHNVTLLDAPIGLTTAFSVPVPARPTQARVNKWRPYIDLPFAELRRIARPFPDFVMVDGRFRRACALATALHAHQANATTDLLFDDYYSAGREHYHQIETLLGEPVRVGRAAHFVIPPAVPITLADIDSALRDFR